MHAFLTDLGLSLIGLGVAGIIATTLLRTTDKPASTPPDPRPPAVNLVWPDDVDALLDDTAHDLVAELERRDPNVLACGYCDQVSIGAGALEAIAADQAHFRTVHALRLAIEVAS